MIRDSINLMVKDLITNTVKNIHNMKIKTINDVYSSKKSIVCFSKGFKEIEKEIKYFLKKNMYDNKNVQIKNDKGKKIIRKLFTIINKKTSKFINSKELKLNKHRAIADFISGMTDRYAINLYKTTK